MALGWSNESHRVQGKETQARHCSRCYQQEELGYRLDGQAVVTVRVQLWKRSVVFALLSVRRHPIAVRWRVYCAHRWQWRSAGTLTCVSSMRGSC